MNIFNKVVFFTIIVSLCFSISSIGLCETKTNNWDQSVRFIDISVNKEVTDDELISTALYCIEKVKSSSPNPFSLKVQDVQYAKSVKIKDNDYFLITYSIGNSNPVSCFVMYDRSEKAVCIFSFDELVYNPAVISQLNGFYVGVMRLSYEGKFTGVVLNEGKWKAKEIGSRLEDFYDIWDAK